jgi:hypothetical protein
VTNLLAHELVIALVTMLAVDVILDLSSRLAHRLVSWSAHRIYAADPERAAERAKEWVSVIDTAPRYLRLCQASLFTGVAMGKATTRRWQSLRREARTRQVRQARQRMDAKSALWVWVTPAPPAPPPSSVRKRTRRSDRPAGKAPPGAPG